MDPQHKGKYFGQYYGIENDKEGERERVPFHGFSFKCEHNLILRKS